MEEEQKNNGGKNLLILCIFTVISAVATTALSLFVYHQSGDIYLDRSRPGFLPESSEKNENSDLNFSFSDSGSLKEKDLEEYIKNLDKVIESLDKMSDPYDKEVLSDENLGI